MIGWILSNFLSVVAAATPAMRDGAVEVSGLSIHDVAMGVIGLAMVLAVVRLLRGPTLADRVVALDLLAFFSVGVVALAAVASDRAELVIVAVVVALLTFMGTAAFALYLERNGLERTGHEDAD